METKSLTLNKKKFEFTSTHLLLIVFAVVFVVFTVMIPDKFFTGKNFMTIAKYSSVFGLIGIGMTFIIIGGEIDLSVAYIVGLSSMVMGTMLQTIDNVVLVAAAGILVGLVCGIFNGFVITKLRLPAFVVTIGTGQMFNGFAQLINNRPQIQFSNDIFREFSKINVFGAIPLPFIILIAAAVLTWFVLKYTVFGRCVYAVGSNKPASRLAGINAAKTNAFTFVISGLMCGIASFMVTSQNGSGIAGAASGAEMDAISAAVLGGASLAGGKGSIVGTLVGVFLLRIISNGMNLMNIETYWQMVVQGSLLIAAVIMDSVKNNKDD